MIHRRKELGVAWLAAILCGALLAGCSRQAVVGSPGRPGGDASEATLRADLEAFQVAEDVFFADNGRYASDLAELDFLPSPGVDVSIIQGDRRGYSAIAATDDAECAAYGGEARPPRSYVTQPGIVGCRP